MKRFLQRVILFLLPLALLVVVPFAVEWHAFRASLRFPDCTMGLMGDSHPACGVNEKLIPGLANFSLQATKTMFWRSKIPFVLEENPQLKLMIIEVWPWVYYDRAEKAARERAKFTRGHIPLTVLFDVMATKDMGGLPRHNLCLKFYRGVIKAFCRRVFLHEDGSGLQLGHTGLKVNLTENNWYKQRPWKFPPPLTVCDAEVNQSRKEIVDCIEYLQSHGVKVALLTMPIWKEFRTNVFAGDVMPRFEQDMNDIAAQYGIPWYNYIDAISDLQCYADKEHLNQRGAIVMSERIRKDLEKYRSGNNR